MMIEFVNKKGDTYTWYTSAGKQSVNSFTSWDIQTTDTLKINNLPETSWVDQVSLFWGYIKYLSQTKNINLIVNQS